MGNWLWWVIGCTGVIFVIVIAVVVFYYKVIVPQTPGFDEGREALSLFWQAKTLDEKKRVVEENPILLTSGPSILNTMQMLSAKNNDEESRRKLEKHVYLLRRSLEVGIEAAFLEEDIRESIENTGESIPTISDFHNVIAKNPDIQEKMMKASKLAGVFPETDEDGEWADAMFMSGLSFMQDPQQENVKNAIQAFKASLQIFKPDIDTEKWQVAMLNLASAYYLYKEGDISENIENSIKTFNEALKNISPEKYPDAYVIGLAGMGNAYCGRILGNRNENFEQAIEIYKKTMPKLSRNENPEVWAEIRHNLAIAYFERHDGDIQENLNLSIRYNQEALEVQTREVAPIKWAETMMELGNAYVKLSIWDGLESSSKAITCYREALTVADKLGNLELMATIKNNLGKLLTIYDSGNSDNNLREAEEALVQAYQLRLQVGSSYEQAQTQMNLGNMYHASYVRKFDRKDINLAIQAYQTSLDLFTPELFAFDCLASSFALGSLLLVAEQWPAAADAFRTALSAAENLYQSSLFPESKLAEESQFLDLYQKAAYVFVQCGDIEEAVTTIETGRARQLRDLSQLAQGEKIRFEGLGFGKLFEQYTNACTQYRTAIDRNRLSKDFSADRRGQAESSLATLKRSIEAIRREVGSKHPEYRYFMSSLSIYNIKNVARDQCIAYIINTDHGGVALLVNYPNIQVIPLKPIDNSLLNMLLLRSPTSGNYSNSQDVSQPVNWRIMLEPITRWLWDAQMGVLTSNLQAQGIRSVILIPSGILTMLPLHAAWTKKDGRHRYACEEITFSYAPSAYAIMTAQAQIKNRNAKTLLAIENPDESLTFSEYEMEHTIKFFIKDDVKHLKGNQAILKDVKNFLPHYGVVHFSSHAVIKFGNLTQSGFLLANGKMLTVDDIYKLQLTKTRLSILAACDSGVLANVKVMDESISLPTAFMLAGVPGVISTLWPVNDPSTALLISRFYDYWKTDNHPPHEALKLAQIWLKSTTKDKLIDYARNTSDSFAQLLLLLDGEPNELIYSQPYWWAGFIFTGC